MPLLRLARGMWHRTGRAYPAGNGTARAAPGSDPCDEGSAPLPLPGMISAIPAVIVHAIMRRVGDSRYSNVPCSGVISEHWPLPGGHITLTASDRSKYGLPCDRWRA